MLTKKFVKSKNICKVTFELPQEIEAKSAVLVGEFNNWDTAAHPMKKVKGVWKTTLDLEQGQEFQYRYLVNGSEWYNDWEADGYAPNLINGDNSVVQTYSN
ncbi:MAG TPA: isoamylase early set domain-containing protein [Anaerolineae bacterium]|nr:isoamylase early set domain-containing protein [Anaerolineae bacterium]